jgi:predicted P-loop ATPase
MNATTRRRAASGDIDELAELAELRAEIAKLRAAQQTVARVTANVAAQNARGPWTDFKKLLSGQYNITPADLELFTDILAGRKP